MLLTRKEKKLVNGLKEGCYVGQPGYSLRAGNDFWHECCGTLGTAGGDNAQHLLIFRKKRVGK